MTLSRSGPKLWGLGFWGPLPPSSLNLKEAPADKFPRGRNNPGIPMGRHTCGSGNTANRKLLLGPPIRKSRRKWRRDFRRHTRGPRPPAVTVALACARLGTPSLELREPKAGDPGRIFYKVSAPLTLSGFPWKRLGKRAPHLRTKPLDFFNHLTAFCASHVAYFIVLVQILIFVSVPSR